MKNGKIYKNKKMLNLVVSKPENDNLRRETAVKTKILNQ